MTIKIELHNDNGNKASYTQTLTVAVPPVFATPLDPKMELTVGTAKTWYIPAPDYKPLNAAVTDSFVVNIPASLQSYLTFN